MENDNAINVPFSLGFLNFREYFIFGFTQNTKGRIVFEKLMLNLLNSDDFGKQTYQYQMKLMIFILNNFFFETANS